MICGEMNSSVGGDPYSPNRRTAFWHIPDLSILGGVDPLDDRQNLSLPIPNHTTYEVAQMQRTPREDTQQDHL